MHRDPTSAEATRRVLVVADRELPGEHHPDLLRVAAAVRGARVFVVAPASPLEGERWVADLTARERRAERRLADWTAALARHAHAVAGEVGDEDPGLAAADGRRLHQPHETVAVLREPGRPRPPAQRGLRVRLRGLLSAGAGAGMPRYQPQP